MADLTGFAVDLGGTKIAAARIEGGQIVARASAPTEGNADAVAQIQTIARLAHEVGYFHGAPLGLAVAGRIDAAGHWHAVNRATLSQIDRVPLAAMVAQALGPCACLNDATAAALAEAQLGAGRGLRNFAYVTVSTGIGAGLVLGGRLLDSPNGLAGHVGFATSRDSHTLCGSGRIGTVESVASGRALAYEAGNGMDARAICAAARDGQAWAEPLVTRSARAVATLLADLTAILGLEGAAIGGSVALSEGYLDRIRVALQAEPPLFQLAVSRAQLGADAPLLGALLGAKAKVTA
jgi:predicted NBD/HSP70 family sugar kinase